MSDEEDEENKSWILRQHEKNMEVLRKLDPMGPVKALNEVKKEMEKLFKDNEDLKKENDELKTGIKERDQRNADLKKSHDDLLERLVRNQKP